jgi:hypothetical protein
MPTPLPADMLMNTLLLPCRALSAQPQATDGSVLTVKKQES